MAARLHQPQALQIVPPLDQALHHRVQLKAQQILSPPSHVKRYIAYYFDQ